MKFYRRSYGGEGAVGGGGRVGRANLQGITI